MKLLPQQLKRGWLENCADIAILGHYVISTDAQSFNSMHDTGCQLWSLSCDGRQAKQAQVSERYRGNAQTKVNMVKAEKCFDRVWQVIYPLVVTTPTPQDSHWSLALDLVCWLRFWLESLALCHCKLWGVVNASRSGSDGVEPTSET